MKINILNLLNRKQNETKFTVILKVEQYKMNPEDQLLLAVSTFMT